MTSTLEAPPAPPETPPPASNADNITALLAAAEKFTETPAPDLTLPPDIPPPPPVTPPAGETTPAPVKTKDDYAKERIAQRENKTAELTSRITEMETQLAELRNAREAAETEKTRLAEALAAEERKLKEVDERWKKDTEPVFNPDELPEVQTVANIFHTGMQDFIPADLSGEDEKPRYVNRDEIIQKHGRSLVQHIENFIKIEQNPNFSPEKKGHYHHALISLIAKDIGVDKNAFESGDLEGEEFGFLSPRHSVFGHVKARLANMARSWVTLQSARQKAFTDHEGSLTGVFDTRMRRSEEAFRSAGITDSDDEINNRLKRDPNDAVALIMKEIKGREDLLKKFNEVVREEAATNASARPHVEVFEKDPAKRNTLLKLRSEKLAKRAVYAPLHEMSIPTLITVIKERNELRERLSKYETAEDRKEAAAEPGAAGLRTSTAKPDTEVAGHKMADLERILNLVPA